MSTYGSRGKNPIKIPSTYEINGKPVSSNNRGDYYPLVNANTGEIIIKSKEVLGDVVQNESLDRTIATISKDGTFIPQRDLLGLVTGNTEELQYFSSPVGQRTVKDAAVKAAEGGGLSPEKARQLIYPNTALANPDQQNPTPAAGSTENQSTGDQSTGDTGSTPPANISSSSITSLPATTGSKSPSSGGPLVYPLKMKDTKQDRIKFTAVEIDEGTGGRTIESAVKYKKVANSNPVYLHIEAPISDQNNVDWGLGTMGPIEKAMFNAAYNALSTSEQPFDAVARGLGNLANEAYTTSKQLSSLATPAFAAMAAGNINLFTRATSLALNPNLELLFNAPQLRPFNFSFLLTARESEEAVQIKKIIKFFKYHMAVRSVESNLFLKSPHVFWIEYQYGNGGETHKSMNLIAPEKVESKACALTSFSVDYTPLGSYMTFNDTEATMVAYKLSMQFMEITPVYQKDYEEGPYADHPIGY